MEATPAQKKTRPLEAKVSVSQTAEVGWKHKVRGGHCFRTGSSRVNQGFVLWYCWRTACPRL